MLLSVTGAAWLTPGGFITGITRPTGMPYRRPKGTMLSMDALDPASVPWLGDRQASRMPELARLCCATVGRVLEEAGTTFPFNTEAGEGERIALVMGNNSSNLRPIEALDKEVDEYGVDKVNPAIFPNTVLNSLGGYISIYFQVRGTNTTLSGGAGTVRASIRYAADLLEKGRHEKVICCHVHLLHDGKAPGKSERITAFLLERPKGMAQKEMPLLEPFADFGCVHNNRGIRCTDACADILLFKAFHHLQGPFSPRPVGALLDTGQFLDRIDQDELKAERL